MYISFRQHNKTQRGLAQTSTAENKSRPFYSNTRGSNRRHGTADPRGLASSPSACTAIGDTPGHAHDCYYHYHLLPCWPTLRHGQERFADKLMASSSVGPKSRSQTAGTAVRTASPVDTGRQQYHINSTTPPASTTCERSHNINIKATTL